MLRCYAIRIYQKKITTESNLSYIPAIKWGIDNENTAKEQYVSKMLATHKNFAHKQDLLLTHFILILAPPLMVLFIVTVVDMGC